MSVTAGSETGRQLMCFPEALPRDPAVAAWLARRTDPLGAIANRWYEVLRDCAPDMRELVHDGAVTLCLGEAAVAYVNVFAQHVNLGFFQGSGLPDPEGLLEGSGKRMRHVKLRPGQEPAAKALRALIEAACIDMRARNLSQ